MTLRAKRKPVSLRDFIDHEHRVICTETFDPWIGRPVQKGEYFRLSDEAVAQFPEMFAVVIPVNELPER